MEKKQAGKMDCFYKNMRMNNYTNFSFSALDTASVAEATCNF